MTTALPPLPPSTHRTHYDHSTAPPPSLNSQDTLWPQHCPPSLPQLTGHTMTTALPPLPPSTHRTHYDHSTAPPSLPQLTGHTMTTALPPLPPSTHRTHYDHSTAPPSLPQLTGHTMTTALPPPSLNSQDTLWPQHSPLPPSTHRTHYDHSTAPPPSLNSQDTLWPQHCPPSLPQLTGHGHCPAQLQDHDVPDEADAQTQHLPKQFRLWAYEHGQEDQYLLGEGHGTVVIPTHCVDLVEQVSWRAWSEEGQHVAMKHNTTLATPPPVKPLD